MGSEEKEYHFTHKRHGHHRRVGDSRTDSESWNDRCERSRRSCDNEFPAIHHVNDRLQEALDYRTNRLAENHPIKTLKSPEASLNGTNVYRTKWSPNLSIRSTRPSLSVSPQRFSLTFDRNGIREGAFLWSLYCLMNLPAPAALNARIALRSNFHEPEEERTFTSYREAASYLLETSSTDDIVVETDPDIMPFTQSPNK